MRMSEGDVKEYGHGVVLAAWLAVLCLFGFLGAFFMMEGAIEESLGLSETQLTVGYSIMIVFFAITGFLCGWMLDRWGSGPAYTLAAVLGGLGLLLTSFAQSPMAYYVSFGVIGGIAVGMMWVSSIVSVRKWYVGKEYARKWGIAFTGAPVSLIILSLIGRGPLRNLTGDTWRTAAQLIAGAVLVILLVAASKAREAPELYGLKPSGSLQSTGKPDEDDHAWNIREAFSTYAIWAVILTTATSALAEFLIWTQAVGYWRTDIGMTLAKATDLYATIGLAGVLSIPIFGVIADRAVRALNHEGKARKLMLIVGPAAGALACILLLVQAHSAYALGVAACSVFAIYWAVVPGGVVGYAGAVYGRRTLGRIWGLATLIAIGIGPLVGLIVGGYMRHASGGNTYSIVLALCAFSASAVLAFSLPRSAMAGEEQESGHVRLTEMAAHRSH
jgi:MFS family permease